MSKVNCWEYKKCGREAGGSKAGELGVCAAASERRTTGCNGGVNAGRACWAIAGTLCGGVVQGTFASKLSNCLQCQFYQLVAVEEGPHLMGPREIIARLG